jgi:iron complex outermembrane receptor protein
MTQKVCCISQSIFKKVSISYAWLNVTKEIGNLHSLYATDFLRHKILAGLDHKIVSKLEARWDISFQKREGTYLGPGNSEIAYKPFMLADFKLLWSGKNITPFIEVTNLFNTDYLFIGNLPQPGRWLKCGINVTL